MNEIELNSFILELGKFSSGKFILFESKLANFLTSLSENTTLYKLIERCLKGFNFEEEFKRCMVSGSFVLPRDLEKVVAVVFCILVEADSKKIDFYKFISGNYPAEDVNESYRKFIDEMIVPFKNAVISLCSDNGEQKIREQTWGEKTESSFVAFKELCTTFDCFSQVEPIIETMGQAIKMENSRLFKALAFALTCASKNRKFKKFAKQFYMQLI